MYELNIALRVTERIEVVHELNIALRVTERIEVVHDLIVFLHEPTSFSAHLTGWGLYPLPGYRRVTGLSRYDPP